MRNSRLIAPIVGAAALSLLAAALLTRTAPPVSAQQREKVQPFTVLLTFGLKDAAPTAWEGGAEATGAQVDQIEGWHFLPAEDRITGPASWRLRTDLPVTGPNQPAPRAASPNGVVLLGTAGEAGRLDVTTNHGRFSFRLADLKLGQPVLVLDGAASVEALPATTKLSDDLRADDFPSIAVDNDGTAWACWQSYSGLRDEIRLRRCTDGRWNTFTRVPGISGDVWRPQVAIDGNHMVWVVWSQQLDGNWDLYARALDGDHWGPMVRLTTDPLPDVNHQLIPDGAGNLLVAWQGFRAGARPNSDIFLKQYDHQAQRWSADTHVSTSAANDWEPAVAVDSKGNAWVAWDSYAAGNYDVLLRSVPLKGAEEGGSARPPAAPPAISVASTPSAEMRASVVCDRADRVWIACEVARPGWGKDQGYTIRQNPAGTPLGGPRDLLVRVFENGRLRETAGSAADAMPAGERGFFFTPRLLVDDAGRVWLNVRHRTNRAVSGPQGNVQQRVYWQQWLTRCDGDRWAPAIVMPNSPGRQSSLSDLAAGPNNTLWLTWNSDSRLFSDPHRPVHDEVYAASLQVTDPVKEPVLKDAAAGGNGSVSQWVNESGRRMGNGEVGKWQDGAVDDEAAWQRERGARTASSTDSRPSSGRAPTPTPVAYQPQPDSDKPLGFHADEPGDLRAIRAYRAKVGGVTTQIVRGDFHRHTELSWDSGGGNDGSLPDLYRYMIDCASMDYGASTDHNAGGDYEYWWWYTQKLTDLYHVPGMYVPLFGYERSVSYPNGHRNILHAQRGVGVVSFFTKPDLNGQRPGIGTGAVLEDDTKLLYGEIRKTHGIAVPHTSATNMGTDWRDNDKALEPVVEIFQGARTNYEYAGAPKSADPEKDAQHIRQAGYEPAGFVWNAWKKGYRLGTISSSDHGSTHMSYALVYTPSPTRQGILDAIRKRHTYGATDNIILEFRIGSGFMGDEISVTGPPTLWVRARGTNELARIDLIKNDTFLYNTDPKGREVSLSFRDLKATKGTAYYYVRLQQTDGQIAWSSPIWVTMK